MKKKRGPDEQPRRQKQTASVQDALDRAEQHYYAGQLEQAGGLYRQILQNQPDQPDALNNLGILLYQVGDLKAAEGLLGRAAVCRPEWAEAHSNLGMVLEAQDRLHEATTCYRRALALEPGFIEAHNALGLVLEQLGNVRDAAECYRAALRVEPGNFQTCNNLGLALEHLGELEEAVRCYRQALALNPNLVEVHNNLGGVLQKQGKWEEAVASYRLALALGPDYAQVHTNLGVVLHEQGNREQAADCHHRALALDPQCVDAHENLALLHYDLEQPVEAIIHYQSALALDSTNARLQYKLGSLFQEEGRLEEALVCYRQALALMPDYAEARWNWELALPMLYRTSEEIPQWRERFEQGLTNLEQSVSLGTVEECKQALRGVSCRTNFFLQYQGMDDTALQRRYGRLVHRIMAANFPQWAMPRVRLPLLPGERIRVGYVSSHFRAHTISKLFLGWIRNHNRNDFEVYIYYTGNLADEFTEQWRSNSDRFHYSSGLESVCTQVASDRLHVLVYTDVGMDSQMTQMAGLRLAPVQCAAWGHPVTTGLPTVDYFLTSDEMEPEDAPQYYSEHLVRLPKISICYPRPVAPEQTGNRRDFGFRDDAVIYLSCQSLFKYLPQFDALFPAIAQQVSNSQFAFISHPGTHTTATFRERLKRTFALAGLDSEDYCILLPQQTQVEYFSLNLVADIFLDTPGWSGGNTTLEALACGLPVVTYPGVFMRGRHTSAMLQVLGTDETLAQDKHAYIDIAVRLGQDPAWREQVVRKTHQRLDRLFEERTCVAALEEFYRQAVLS